MRLLLEQGVHDIRVKDLNFLLLEMSGYLEWSFKVKVSLGGWLVVIALARGALQHGLPQDVGLGTKLTSGATTIEIGLAMIAKTLHNGFDKAGNVFGGMGSDVRSKENVRERTLIALLASAF